VAKEVTLSLTSVGSITIPRGNWDFAGLANYLNDWFLDQGIFTIVTPDFMRMKYMFYPSISISASGTTCHALLGLDDGVDYVDITESPNVVDFYTLKQVHVFISPGLTSYSFGSAHCCNSLLGSTDVTVPYGCMISHVSTTDDRLRVFDMNSDKLIFCLTDQNGHYLNITKPWSVSVRFTDIFIDNR
jgi:hypothetical protein